MKNLTIIAVFVVSLLLIPSASAGEPLIAVQKQLDKVVDLLFTPEEEEEGPKLSEDEQMLAMRIIVDDAFDFEAISRRALSREKKKFTESQYDRFVSLFTDILFTTYYKRMSVYEVDEIVYKNERIFPGDRAEVETVVETADQSYSIIYRLVKKTDKWLVNDVVIEGVSLVRNYRSQFASILRSKSSEQLIDMLSEKVNPE